MTPNPSIMRIMTETLPSWRDGAAKQAITDFVARGRRPIAAFGNKLEKPRAVCPVGSHRK
jgi:hypothetical protein